jgi:8-hydroxy-5-deazaflavin:NADPH oxidoreductase
MRIGIIGAGWLGGTVGKIWVRAGHSVLFSSRHPEAHAGMVRELGESASAGTMRDAAEFGEVILVAVPYHALEQVGSDLHDALVGKVVLDATNPYLRDPAPLVKKVMAQGVAIASLERLPNVRLVRAFSAVDATAIEASSQGRGRALGVPLASNDAQALAIASELVRDAGCEPVIVGDLEQAVKFQRGGPGFRVHLTAPELRLTLGL